ncbi:MAG TPA: hypothetical protein VI864_08725 [Candidatus Bathyarchaeia archaeon]|nr:hypothetical protein [Candidatus Bathyarchaeia archaeon]
MHYNELVDKINHFEEEYELIELVYSGAIERLKGVQRDIGTIDDVKHIQRIIKPFLIGWGMMNRVVGRTGLKWKMLGEKLRNLEKEFGLLRGENFLTVKFDDKEISDSIKTIYGELDAIPYIGSPTTLSKILHLLNPKIFVMWDNAIEEHYHRINHRVDCTAEGYLEFLKETQKAVLEALNEHKKATGKTLDTIEKELESKYKNKTITKLIDEYNWV